MKVIGLTGGIGSGKSTVAGYLAGLGAKGIDLDKVGHEVIKSDRRVFKRIVDEFGEDILDARGEIDRDRLAKIVFQDRKALARLNRIVHPAIDKVIDDRIKEYRARGVKVVVLEAAAMLEAGKVGQADELWVTTASEATVLGRLKKRSGYSEQEIKARMRSQLSNEERLKKADVVINTDGSLNLVKAMVEVEWHRLMGRIEE
jgi:dephospho-CoA kinase